MHPDDDQSFHHRGTLIVPQDDSTMHLHLPKYSQPHHNNCLKTKYWNLQNGIWLWGTPAATYLFSSAGTPLIPCLWWWLYTATVSTALLRQTVLKSMCAKWCNQDDYQLSSHLKAVRITQFFNSQVIPFLCSLLNSGPTYTYHMQANVDIAV